MSDVAVPGDPSPEGWIELPHGEWGPTRSALHLFCQVIGKIRMCCGPWLNHSWGVTLYVNARGMGTGLVPYEHRGFQIDVDLIGDRVTIATTDGDTREIELRPMSVADFHRQALDAMSALGVPVRVYAMPNEIEGAVRFDQDTATRAYDGDHARAMWRALVQAHRVFSGFRAGYVGKASPVHLFWGALDLAVTRFSGRTAPDHPGGMPNFPLDVAQEAYSHEVTSCGLWLGGDDAPQPLFYAYAYPSPEGFSGADVRPDEAFWYDDLGEFVLPYDAVRAAPDPDGALMDFLQSTHAAAADLAGWPRQELERPAALGPEWWRDRMR